MLGVQEEGGPSQGALQVHLCVLSKASPRRGPQLHVRLPGREPEETRKVESANRSPKNEQTYVR